MDLLRLRQQNQNQISAILLENARRQRWVQQMEDVMPLVASSADDCKLYHLAKAQCSENVWLSEADPIRFLQYCQGNPWEASKRMMEYWKLRREIFGPDRFWKRVLDTSGTQALSTVAAREVHISYLLPPDIQHGRTVLLHYISAEAEKVYSQMLPSERNETMFYALQLAVWGSSCSSLPIGSTAAAARNRHGFRFVQVRLGSGFKTFPELQRLFARAMQSCFPIACQGIHIVCAPKLKPGLKLRFANQILPFVWKLMETLFSNAERRTLDFVAWSDELDRNQKLEEILANKLGLDPRGLPPLAGGVWDHESFAISKWATTHGNTMVSSSSFSSSSFLSSSPTGMFHPPINAKEMTLLSSSTAVPSMTDSINSLDLLASMALLIQMRSATGRKRGVVVEGTSTTTTNHDLEPSPNAKRSRLQK